MLESHSSPDDGGTLARRPVTLRWTASSDEDGDPVRYWLRLSGPGIDTLHASIADTQLVLNEPRLQPMKTYYWYVEARDTFSVARSEKTFRFVAPRATDIDPVQPDAIPAVFSLYPNPSSGMIVVSCRLRGPSPIRIALIDSRGALVAEQRDEASGSGIHSTAISLQHLPTGFYLCRLTAEGMSRTKMFSILR